MAVLARETMNEVSRKRGARWGLRRSLAFGAVAATALLTLAWYMLGVIGGEYLRQATAESARICRSLIGNSECPDLLLLPGHDPPALDPWGEPYYCRRTREGVLAIGSHGADGEAGGCGRGHGDVECAPSDTVSGHDFCSCRVKTSGHEQTGK